MRVTEALTAANVWEYEFEVKGVMPESQVKSRVLAFIWDDYEWESEKKQEGSYNPGGSF